MSKHIGAYSSLHGPAGKPLTDYVEENIPSLWNCVPERIESVANDGQEYTGVIPGWTTANPLAYTENKIFFFTPHVTNLSSPLLSLNGLPLLPILDPQTRSGIPAGTLKPGSEYVLWIRSSAFEILFNLHSSSTPVYGTWNPTLFDLIGNQEAELVPLSGGGYARSGESVFLYGYLQTANVPVMNGQLCIGGIPFTPNFSPGVAGRTGGAVTFWSGFTLPAGAFGLNIFLQEAGRLRLYHAVANNGTRPVTEALITSQISLYFNLTYRAIL